jgi:hypothetical protein
MIHIFPHLRPWILLQHGLGGERLAQCVGVGGGQKPGDFVGHMMGAGRAGRTWRPVPHVNGDHRDQKDVHSQRQRQRP